MSKLISKYRNGNYEVKLYDDGTKVRLTKESEWKPEFAECIDMTVTEKCSGGCPFCYANCWENGPSADIHDPGVRKFLKSIKPYTEVAINLNDMRWVELPTLLHILKEQLIITNGTINAKHLSIKNISQIRNWQDAHMLYGIGISVNDFEKDDVALAHSLPYLDNTVIHVVAGVLDKKNIELLLNQDNIEDLKVLILGYKKDVRGRASDFFEKNKQEIYRNINDLKEALPELSKKVNVLAFDGLALEQLDAAQLVSEKEWERRYQGGEGEFTYFVNLVKKKFGINSMVSEDKMHDLIYDSEKCFDIIREEAGYVSTK